MSMSKKDFIELADTIRDENAYAANYNQPAPFSEATIKILARFCKGQNYNFMESRWLDYIAGKCGPGGGDPKKVKKSA